MPSGPLVSIITPSLNQGQFIEECILSIKNQTYANLEHIIIDGGSTDQTLEIIQKYANTYSMRWISEPDQGMYYAINKGFKLAKGEILAYLNADDLYFPWSVEEAVTYLVKYPSIGLVYSDMIKLQNGVMWPRFYPPFSFFYYALYDAIGQPTVFWKREVFKQCGLFDKSYYSSADWEYWLRAAKSGFNMRKMKEFLAVDRVHPAQIRVRKKLLCTMEMKKIRLQYARNFLWLRPLFHLYALVVKIPLRLQLVLTKKGWPRFRSYINLNHQVRMNYWRR